MSKVTETVSRLAEPIVRELGCEVWDVEYVKEAGEWYLRVYIDKEGGVSINDCVAVTQALDPILDEEDPIPDSYTFEVSSAGLERQLKRPSDFEKFLASPVTVKLYRAVNGSREKLGVLSAYKDGDVTLKLEDGTEETYAKADVAMVRLRYVD